MATGRIGVTPNLGIRWSKVPTGGTTSLSGNDDNSVPLAYSAGYEAVYRNGVLLSRGNDYTATNGTSITLVDATITGDLIEVFANQTVALTDTYSQSAANAKFINNTLTTTTGDIIYASAANTPARLGIGSTDQVLKVSSGIPAWGAVPYPTFVGCQAKITAAQSLSNATQTVINFAAEDFDTNSFHDNSTNNGRMTIPSGYGGYYRIGAGVCLENMPTDNNFNIVIKKNGNNSTFWGGSYNSGPVLTMGYIGVVINLAVGDYIEVQAYQNSGSTVTTVYDPNNAFGYFNVQFLGA